MKRLIILLTVIGINSQVFGFTDPDKIDEETLTSEQIANHLYQVFHHYKNQDIKTCKELMGQMSYKLTKEVEQKVPKSAVVDSIVFENEKLSRWAYYKSVDLDYIRDIEAVIVMKHENSKSIVESLKEVMAIKYNLLAEKKNGESLSFRFQDLKGAEVIDDRLKVTTISQVPSLYKYEISAEGEYIIIDLKESIPNKVVRDYEIARR